MRLTPHFSTAEFCTSTTAHRRGINNDPPEAVEHNLLALAFALEAVRGVLDDKPIIVTSGYRCPELNKVVGGVPDSAHLTGLAADFISPKFGVPRQVAMRLKEHQHRLPFGVKVLLEFNRWIHFRVPPPTGGKRRFIEAEKVDGKTVYRPLPGGST